MQTPHSLVECVHVFAQRSLVFPLVRHFGLVQRVVVDTVKLLKLGETTDCFCIRTVSYNSV